MLTEDVKAWRAGGKHLPKILRDFNDQVTIFRTMHEMIGEPRETDTIRRPTTVEGQCYVIDCFLWFMARHGYTLQKSRTKLDFDSLTANIDAIEKMRTEKTLKMLKERNTEMSEKLHEWKIQINAGPIQDLKTKTSIYGRAAAAAIATLDFEESNDGFNIVKIWCEHLLPDYGPYFYQVSDFSVCSIPAETFDW